MGNITANSLERVFADVAGAGTYGCFEYQGVALGFYSDEEALLERFSQYFGGYFTVTTSHRTDAVVYSSRDPAVFRRLKQQATADGRRRSEAETEHAVDEHHSIIYRGEVAEAKGKVAEHCVALSRQGRQVLMSSPDSTARRPTAVKRSLRNLMKLLLVEKGWLPLHSAACMVNDTGVCILGGKFAGKTSTLVNLLTRPGARFVSNDNLFLRDGGACLEGCGFPNNTGLRVGTLAAYPWLVDRLERATGSFHPRIDAKTVRDILATTPAAELSGRPEKIVLLSTELALLLDVPIEQVTPMELFLIVQFDPSLEQSRLAPLTDPQQIRASLAANFRSLGKEKQDFLQRFFDFDDDSLRGAFDALLGKFSSRVTVQELYQNANTNEHSAELVEGLTRRVREHA